VQELRLHVKVITPAAVFAPTLLSGCRGGSLPLPAFPMVMFTRPAYISRGFPVARMNGSSLSLFPCAFTCQISKLCPSRAMHNAYVNVLIGKWRKRTSPKQSGHWARRPVRLPALGGLSKPDRYTAH